MRIDKYIYRTKVDIFVRGFCCTPHHTASLAGILSKRFIVMLIDELPVKDFALKPFTEYGILYYFHSDKRRNALLALIPISHKNVIAEMMQEWDIGNVLLFNLKDDAQWKDCSHNVLKLSPKYLFSEDMSSMGDCD